MKKQVYVISNLVCEECGSSFKLPRKRAKRREEGHIKHMHCVKCNKVTAHVEDNRSQAEKYWDSLQEELQSK